MARADEHVKDAINYYMKTAVDFVCAQGNKVLQPDDYSDAVQRHKTRIIRTERLLDTAAQEGNLAKVIEHGRTYMLLHKRAFEEYAKERYA